MVKHLLYVYVRNQEDLVQWYQNKCAEHNVKATGQYPDSGFDLVCPAEATLSGRGQLYGYQIETSMYKSDTDIDLATVNVDTLTPSAFYLYPRSSISSTPLRLANSVGIIDSGYRGEIKASFDVHENYTVKKFQRVVQLCTPTLEPMFVLVVNSLSETARGSGGFGSTGV
jgi:dUTPase